MRKAYRRRGGLRHVLAITFALLICSLLLLLPIEMLKDLDALMQYVDPPDGYPGRNWASIVSIFSIVGLLSFFVVLAVSAFLWRSRHLLHLISESAGAAFELGRPYRFVEDRRLLHLQGLLFASLGLAGGIMLIVGIVQLVKPYTNTASDSCAIAVGGLFLFKFLIIWRKVRWPSSRPNVLTIDARGVAANWSDPPFVPWAAIRHINVFKEPGRTWHRDADHIYILFQGEVPDETGALILSQTVLIGMSATVLLRALDRFRPARVPIHDPRGQEDDA